MRAPILFLDDPVFPGQFATVSVPRDVGEDLDALWQLEGFGCLEAALAFPKDRGQPASTENQHTIGVLAEVVIERGDLLRGRERVRLHLGESHRVAIDRVTDAPKGYGEAWPRPFAELSSRPPTTENVDEAALTRLRREAAEIVLTKPEVVASDDGTTHELAGTIVDLANTDVADWQIVYLIADFLLTDGEERRQALATDDLSQIVPLLAERAQAHLEVPSDEASATVELMLGFAADESLQHVLDALQATLVVAQSGLVELPGSAERKVRKLHRELERSLLRLEDVAETIANFHAGEAEENEDGAAGEDEEDEA